MTLNECIKLREITEPGRYLAQYKQVSIEIVLVGAVPVIRSGRSRHWWQFYHYLNVPTSDVFLLPIRKTFERYLEALA